MGARETLSRLAEAGFTLRLNDAGDKVQIRPLPVPDELVALVRADKPDLLRILAAEKPADEFPLHPSTGAPFMPWCAPVTPADFTRWRNELIHMIEELALLECWPRDHLDDVLTRAINGPVSDLRPNWHYFGKQLKQARPRSGTNQKTKG